MSEATDLFEQTELSAAARHIGESALGAELTPAEQEVLAQIMGERLLQKGEILAAAGDSDPRLYLLVSGGLSVLDTDAEGKALLYRLRVGETAGTRAFVDRRPRNATLRADEACTVYYLEPEPFEALLGSRPQIVYKVMRALFRITHANLMRMNAESGELANYVRKAGGRY